MGKKKIVYDEPFRGKIEKICIWSSRYIDPCFAIPGKEVEQKLTIDRKGHVHWKGYDFAPPDEKHELSYRNKKLRDERRKIFQKDAKYLLNSLATSFDKDYCPAIKIPYFPPTGYGGWELRLTNNKGKIYQFNGSFGEDSEFQKVNLSSLSACLREILCAPDFLAFDGRSRL